MNTRREFLKKAAVTTGLTALGLHQTINAKEEPSGKKEALLELKNNCTILFQGDSITDAGRDWGNNTPNSSKNLGHGYVSHLAAYLLTTYPEKNLTLYNKGISGNKVFELRGRWDNDCINLKPDILSIMIGVNDFWHTLDFGYNATVKKYEDDYRSLLNYTKEKLPNVQLIIGEPFGIKGVGVVSDKWYPDFDEYRAVAKKMADEFGALFIPYQSYFDSAIKKSFAPNYWTGDGVHPSIAGEGLMAKSWLMTARL